MTSSARFWDRIAESYAKSPIRDEAAYAATLARVRAYLTPEARVLELGCGTGTTAVKLAGDAGSILATDVAENMIAIGRRRAAEAGAGNVTFARRDVADATDDGAAFDVVMAFNLLHLVADLDAALAAMAGALRPGGTLIVKATCLAEPGLSLKIRLMLLALPVLQVIGKAPSVAYLSVDALETAVRRAGLEIVETGNYPEMPLNRFIVARKTA